MGYKFKPNKGVGKRFRLTKSGKLKRNHAFTSHLKSGRRAGKRRMLRRPAILSESLARNMRKLIGAEGVHPGKPTPPRKAAAAAV